MLGSRAGCGAARGARGGQVGGAERGDHRHVHPQLIAARSSPAVHLLLERVRVSKKRASDPFSCLPIILPAAARASPPHALPAPRVSRAVPVRSSGAHAYKVRCAPAPNCTRVGGGRRHLNAHGGCRIRSAARRCATQRCDPPAPPGLVACARLHAGGARLGPRRLLPRRRAGARPTAGRRTRRSAGSAAAFRRLPPLCLCADLTSQRARGAPWRPPPAWRLARHSDPWADATDSTC